MAPLITTSAKCKKISLGKAQSSFWPIARICAWRHPHVKWRVDCCDNLRAPLFGEVYFQCFVVVVVGLEREFVSKGLCIAHDSMSPSAFPFVYIRITLAERGRVLMRSDSLGRLSAASNYLLNSIETLQSSPHPLFFPQQLSCLIVRCSFFIYLLITGIN